MKVAYVHDWLVDYRGGEKVLEALLEIYPEAPVYTLFYEKSAMPVSISNRNIIFPGWLKPFTRFRKFLLPILPAIIETLPLEDYDLIISSSSCVAKGVIGGPETKHISYIHSPMRYVWDQRQHYLASKPRLLRPIIQLFSNFLRIWDITSTSRVDVIITNSSFIAARVNRYYDRLAGVIHPPVEIERFITDDPAKQGYILAAGAFVPYKGFDLAIKACESLGIKLVIAGSGEQEKPLRKLAGLNTSFVINPDDAALTKLLQRADAFLFPGVEDFGIIAIEALAAGTPLIALKKGGAMDFVQPGETGIFFDSQTTESIGNALKNFNSENFSRSKLIEFSRKFSKAAFLDEFKTKISQLTRGEEH